MAQPWSYSFAFSDGESEGEGEDSTITTAQQMQGVQLAEQLVEQELSEDTRLARDLDISTRKDTAMFRKTPWTVAKSNAASRKPSIPSITDPNTLTSSNGSFLTTESTKRPKEVSQKNLTDHFRRRSNRKETSGSTVERTKKKPAVHETVITELALPKKEASPQDIRSLPQKQTRPLRSHPFITPLKHPLQSPTTKKLAPSKVEAVLIPPKSIAPTVRHVASTASTTPGRLNFKQETITPTVKREILTPTTKRAGDTFRASTPLSHIALFTPLKRKRGSSPSELSATLPDIPQRSSSPVHKRVQKGESPPLPRKPVLNTVRQVQGAPVYGNGAFVSNDEQWSTLPTKKKPQSTSVKNPSSNRLTTGGFRLPTSFLGVPKNVENVQGKVRSKMTLLTLYQPPPPLPSSRPCEKMDKAMESASEPSDDISSGESGGSGGSAMEGASPEDQEGDFRFSCPGWGPIVEKDDQDMPFAQEEDEKDEKHYESDLVASLDSATLHTRFPRLVDGLQERHRLLRLPLWELLGMDSCGIVWDDGWTGEGDTMRIPVFRLQGTDGYSEVPN